MNNDKKGYVYLLTDTLSDDMYKIGVTTGTIERRIKKLQTGNPGEIYMCQYYQTDHPFFVEKQLHFKLKEFKVLNEWFHLSNGEALNFKKYCEESEKLIDILKDNPFFTKNPK